MTKCPLQRIHMKISQFSTTFADYYFHPYGQYLTVMDNEVLLSVYLESMSSIHMDNVKLSKFYVLVVIESQLSWTKQTICPTRCLIVNLF